ncbi:hypothetical protein K0A97_02680 [Patescibacteria group bacterium]|nr:hypothetical protein [Patescibacteria group bacterium]
MKVIGFNFTKIDAEKIKENSEGLKLKIGTSIDISQIKEVKFKILKTKEHILGIDFSFNVKYEPDMAKVSLLGKLLVSLEPKLAKEVLNQWKDKKMPEDFKFFLFNVILKKSTLKALYIEEDLNLPLHMPMPSFKKENKESN